LPESPTQFGALLGIDQLSAYVGGLSKRQLWKLVAAGDLPKPIHPPGTRRALWVREDIDSCIARWERGKR
jgi:predicted DNA-binding transcriptional regulator AlpA